MEFRRCTRGQSIPSLPVTLMIATTYLSIQSTGDRLLDGVPCPSPKDRRAEHVTPLHSHPSTGMGRDDGGQVQSCPGSPVTT